MWMTTRLVRRPFAIPSWCRYSRTFLGGTSRLCHRGACNVSPQSPVWPTLWSIRSKTVIHNPDMSHRRDLSRAAPIWSGSKWCNHLMNSFLLLFTCQLIGKVWQIQWLLYSLLPHYIINYQFQRHSDAKDWPRLLPRKCNDTDWFFACVDWDLE